MNLAVLRGTLSSDPRLRELPSGSLLASLEVTVRADGARTSTVPVAWHDPPAAALATLHAGDEVVVTGRVERRFFRAGGRTASATEVVAERVVPAPRRARVERVLREAATSLGAASD